GVEWLQAEGYVTRQGGTVGLLEKILTRLNIRKSDIRTFMKKTGMLGLKRYIPQDVQEAAPGAPKIASIDWDESDAYSIGYGRISLLDPSKRDEIKAKLLDLEDPETGEPVFETVHQQEEVYHGPVADQGPDLIPEWPEKYAIKSWSGDHVFDDKFCAHQQDGIYAFRAPGVEPGRGEKRNIVDVMPTLFHLAGLDVPADMDGDVIVTAGTEPERREHSPAAGLDI
ncbi:MAG: hypothetical protein ABEK12_01050, partial [Candidatus Nanohaloarchaea archaeon]